MRYLFLVLTVIALSGCQTDSYGNRESGWEAIKRWDESLNETESRLQSKNYQQ